MEPTLFRYIWRHSRRDQAMILGLVLLALPVYFASLNLPKAIVNGPIDGTGFEEPGATGSFLRITLPFGGSDGEPAVLFEGFALERLDMLFALSFLFLGLVLINGGFKYLINTFKGQLGERVLRRLRYELVDRVLRFPVPYFRKVKASEVASMVKDEVEPLGGFIGDAYVVPVYQSGLALTALGFIMVQSFWLGLLALSVVLIQAFLIPKLRQPILRLGRARQLAARDLSGRVAEIVDAIGEVRTHDTSNYERSDLTRRLGRIFEIRYEIFRRKFFIKFLNNFLSQVTPFLFYAVGGYFAIQGQMDIGQLVAVIAAYKDLPGPVKELINWDHQRMDVQIKYEQVVDQFDPDGILPPELQRLPDGDVPSIAGPLAAKNVSLIDETGARLLERVSFGFDAGKRVTIVGPPGGGKEYLGDVLARLQPVSSGSVTLGGKDITQLPEFVVGRRMGYVGQEAYLFHASVRDNLIYGLRHAPWLDEVPEDEHTRHAWEHEREEAEAAGNASRSLHADWIDYGGAGATGPDDLDARLLDVARTVDLIDDIYEFGLHGVIDRKSNQDLVAKLLEARARLSERLQDPQYQGLVEWFDLARFNRNASIAENILFGAPCGTAFTGDDLATHPYMQQVLEEAGLVEPLLDRGLEIAATMVEIFEGLPEDHPFFEQFSFVSAHELADIQAMLVKVKRQGFDALAPDERFRLKALPFSYIEARHRLGLVTPEIEARILKAREIFMRDLPPELDTAIQFFNPHSFNGNASIEDNLLLGRIVYGQARADQTVRQLIGEVLDELDLTQAILRIGLAFDVGTRGKRLTAAQRQKIGLGRALVKRPDVLIINLALAVLDSASQERVMTNVLNWPETRGVVWVLVRPELADRFDHILVVEGGQVVDQGGFADLAKRSKPFRRLLPALYLAEDRNESQGRSGPAS